jgi:hypothetical protein
MLSRSGGRHDDLDVIAVDRASSVDACAWVCSTADFDTS